ncbi:MAG: hypothetical protein ACI8PT_003595 [Gammaproteobacteria bacterium]|jgi:hypothetical protein
MQNIDVDIARASAIARAIRALGPALATVRAEHGAHVTALALQAALTDCHLEIEHAKRSRTQLHAAREPHR